MGINIPENTCMLVIKVTPKPRKEKQKKISDEKKVAKLVFEKIIAPAIASKHKLNIYYRLYAVNLLGRYALVCIVPSRDKRYIMPKLYAAISKRRNCSLEDLDWYIFWETPKDEEKKTVTESRWNTAQFEIENNKLKARLVR